MKATNIDPILAAEMVRVKELFEREPDRFDGQCSKVETKSDLIFRAGCGCICAHIAGENQFADVIEKYPQHRAH